MGDTSLYRFMGGGNRRIGALVVVITGFLRLGILNQAKDKNDYSLHSHRTDGATLWTVQSHS